MFGARVVRQKRERERAERDLLDLDSRLENIILRLLKYALTLLNSRPTIPYIKPFGERFDPSQLPYFKYRKALAELELERGACLEVSTSRGSWRNFNITFDSSFVMSIKLCAVIALNVFR